MNTVRDLKLLPVWVDPRHLALTALHVMLGHRMKALGVLNGTELVGTVALEDLLGAPEGARIESLMKAPAPVITADLEVRMVAQMFVDDDIDFAPVVDGDIYLGMVTPVMLLRELGQSYDPLTKLSWSDQLREWGVDHLKKGEEVTIIFVDLDRFGIYNKKYGHIVGDKVIQKVASFLSEHIDRELDVLVRYGGDEFAIGTLRDRDESEALAELLVKRFNGEVEGAEEPVSFSTGVFGGRRNKERESVHYAATIDNLINIASKNCIANKRKAREEETVEDRRPAPAYKLLGIYSDEADPNAITTVIVSSNDNVYSGADSKGAKSIVESIAAATIKAMERSSPEVQLELVAIDLLQEGDAQVVTVTGRSKNGKSERSVSAARRVTGQLADAVAEAAIEAFLS
jgi:diguanylate cyclase (GGDEF)-like protein